MKIAITGGDGFIGSNMVAHLLRCGYSIRVIERKQASSAKRIGPLVGQVEWVSGDCGDRSFCRDAFDGVNIVYHFSSSTNPALTWQDPAKEVSEGILRSVVCLEAAAAAGVEKFVLPSSGGTVYGRKQGRLGEGELLAPFTPYGIGKYAVELFSHSIAQRTGMRIDIFRLSNPYGPGQLGHLRQGVIAVWMERILNGETLHVFGDNETKRDYIYISDACELMTHSISCVDSSGTYNIGSGETISTLDLLQLVQDMVPVSFAVQIEPRRDFDNVITCLDNSLILKRFPNFKFIPLGDGLRRTWQWQVERRSVQHDSAEPKEVMEARLNPR